MVITTNMPALNAWGRNKTAGNQVSKSLEKLSSGYRINRAADDAAGLGISEKMRAQIAGLNRSSLNVADGMSLISTADGALGTLNDMFKRAEELCIAAANGTIGATERKNISAELEEIVAEVDRIAQATRFNEIPLFQYTKMLTTSQKVLEDVTYTTTMNPIPASVLPPSVELTPPVTHIPATLKMSFLPLGPTLADAFNGQNITFQTRSAPPVHKTISFSNSAPPLAPGQVPIPNPTDPISDAGIQATFNQLLPLLRPEISSIRYAAGEVTFTHAAMPGSFLGQRITDMKSGNGSTISGFLGLGEFTGGRDAVPLNTTLDFSALATPADIASLHQTSFTVDCGTCENIISRVIFIDSTRYTGPPIADKTVTGPITTHNLVVDISTIGTAADLTATIAASWRQPHFTDFTVDPANPAKLVAHRNDLRADYRAYAKTSTQQLSWTKKEWVDKPASAEAEASIDIFVASLPHQEFISLRLPHFSAESLSLTGVSLSSANDALLYKEKVRAADQTITAARANLGADYNRLACTAKTVENTGQNMQDAESRIRDLDMAKEYSKFLATNLLAQASSAMLAQANTLPKAVLSLLTA